MWCPLFSNVVLAFIRFTSGVMTAITLPVVIITAIHDTLSASNTLRNNMTNCYICNTLEKHVVLYKPVPAQE